MAELPEYHIVKVRNGLWQVLQGKRVVSEHSMQSEAERMIKTLQTIFNKENLPDWDKS